MKKLSLFIMIFLSIFLLTGCGNEKENQDKVNDEEKKEEIVIPEEPATNTEELKENFEMAEVTKITKDKIVFEQKAPVEEGDKVAVWVYSEPKFLGYFEVKIVNGEKIIEGLEEKLKELDIDSGEHNIAIATEEGENLGYIDIVIEESGEVKEEEIERIVIKTITEEEIIKYTTETKKDTNLASGKKEITQKGENGTKEVTYKVTYDTNGVEISREKLSEKVIKEVVKQIEKIGQSNFNLNTAKVKGHTGGCICLESQLHSNGEGCDDFIVGEQQYIAVNVDGTYYAKCSDYSDACKKLGLKTSTKLTKSGNIYTAQINGKKYYFDIRLGDSAPENLTQEKCNEYNLSCGRW